MRGSIRFTTPMLFGLGCGPNCVIGGLSGIYMASTAVDIYIHDTCFIVAHFPYVIADIIFAMFAAIYYWFPKLVGRMMNERSGKIHFVLTFIFFNATFFPMHIFFFIIFAGRKAERNPWKANTLEWSAPSPPSHLNWGEKIPVVYRGPCKYSHPSVDEDWLPQDRPLVPHPQAAY